MQTETVTPSVTDDEASTEFVTPALTPRDLDNTFQWDEDQGEFALAREQEAWDGEERDRRLRYGAETGSSIGEEGADRSFYSDEEGADVDELERRRREGTATPVARRLERSGTVKHAEEIEGETWRSPELEATPRKKQVEDDGGEISRTLDSEATPRKKQIEEGKSRDIMMFLGPEPDIMPAGESALREPTTVAPIEQQETDVSGIEATPRAKEKAPAREMDLGRADTVQRAKERSSNRDRDLGQADTIQRVKGKVPVEETFPEKETQTMIASAPTERSGAEMHEVSNQPAQSTQDDIMFVKVDEAYKDGGEAVRASPVDTDSAFDSRPTTFPAVALDRNEEQRRLDTQDATSTTCLPPQPTYSATVSDTSEPERSFAEASTIVAAESSRAASARQIPHDSDRELQSGRISSRQSIDGGNWFTSSRQHSAVPLANPPEQDRNDPRLKAVEELRKRMSSGSDLNERTQVKSGRASRSSPRASTPAHLEVIPHEEPLEEIERPNNAPAPAQTELQKRDEDADPRLQAVVDLRKRMSTRSELSSKAVNRKSARASRSNVRLSTAAPTEVEHEKHVSTSGPNDRAIVTQEQAQITEKGATDAPDGAAAAANAGVGQEGEKKVGEEEEDESKYPNGFALTILTVGLALATFVIALDNTIIATAIPRITTDFNSLNDVGWYGSAYLLTTCSLQPTFGKIYTYFDIKWTYICALTIFEVGSIVCAAAPNSTVLIIGRAIAGVGAAALFSGGLVIVGYSVPLRKRAIYIALLSSMFGISSVVGPLLGGVFTDKATWRWCFWINLPFGGIALLTTFVFFKSPERKRSSLSFRQKLGEMDLLGGFFLICGIVCLLLALQWGGTTYEWKDSRVWGCLLGFGLLISIFIAVQIWRGEKGTVPPRIISQRSIASGCSFEAFISMALYAHIYFLPFYFQAVKSTTAEGSGIRTIPYLVSMTLASVVVGALITTFGPYAPFLWAGAAVFTIGSGMLYTLGVDDGADRWIGFQLLAGIGAGSSIQIPFISAQVVCTTQDMPTANALTIFFNTLGGALAVSIAQNIFSNTLARELLTRAPGLDPNLIVMAGATHVVEVTPPPLLRGVLEAYDLAVTKAFVLAIGAGGAAWLVGLAMEQRSVKGKKIGLAGGA